MKRIKYISRFTRSYSRHEIDNLVKKSAENNKKHDITGVLMTAGGIFFQIIEGPDDKVDALYRNIVADPRHTDILLLGVENDVQSRLFPDWSMMKMDLDFESNARTDTMKTMMEAVVDLQRVADKMARSLEIAAWTELMNR